MYLASYLPAWNGKVYYEVENLSAAEDEEIGQEGVENRQQTVVPQIDSTAGSDSDDGGDAQADGNSMVVVGWVGSSFLFNDGTRNMKHIFWGIMSNGYVMHRCDAIFQNLVMV